MAIWTKEEWDLHRARFARDRALGRYNQAADYRVRDGDTLAALMIAELDYLDAELRVQECELRLAVSRVPFPRAN